jgi:hypothetical protein
MAIVALVALGDSSGMVEDSRIMRVESTYSTE